MEQVYKTAILKKISYYLVKISVLEADIDNLHLEKKILLFKESELEHDDAIENTFHLRF